VPFGFDRDSHAPIVVLWYRGQTHRDEVQACLDALAEEFESWSGPGWILFDFGGVSEFDSANRRLLASWRAKNAPLIRQKIDAAAYVFTSRLTRGFLTAVDWLRPNDGMVRRFFQSRAEAIDWLQAREAA